MKHVCFAILSNWLEVLLAVFIIVILIGGVPTIWYALLALLGVLTARELLQGITKFFNRKLSKFHSCYVG